MTGTTKRFVLVAGNIGSGKTSSLLTLAGELPPLAGEVRLLGQATTAPIAIVSGR